MDPSMIKDQIRSISNPYSIKENAGPKNENKLQPIQEERQVSNPKNYKFLTVPGQINRLQVKISQYIMNL
jgi:hypothetical protein